MSPSDVTGVPVGPGAASAEHVRGPDWMVEYVEGDRMFRQLWEPREMGVSLIVLLDRWSKPRDLPTTDDERERIAAGLWAAGHAVGVRAVVEHRPECLVVHHWDRGDQGFAVHLDHDTVEYRELGRTLKLPFRADRADPFRRTVEVPVELRWTYPPGAGVSPDERASIIERLRGAKMVVS